MVLMIVAAATVVTWLFIIRHLLFAQSFQTFFRAVALISCTRFKHVINNRVIAIKTFGLEIRAFIPLQIKPVHTIHNGFDCFRRGTFEIGIFDTQHKLTALVASKQPGIESSTRAADVQIASRAWREASFDFHEVALQ